MGTVAAARSAGMFLADVSATAMKAADGRKETVEVSILRRKSFVRTNTHAEHARTRTHDKHARYARANTHARHAPARTTRTHMHARTNARAHSVGRRLLCCHVLAVSGECAPKYANKCGKKGKCNKNNNGKYACGCNDGYYRVKNRCAGKNILHNVYHCQGKPSIVLYMCVYNSIRYICKSNGLYEK